MIEITKEELLTLQKAARLLPRRRKGKQVHASTLYRWAAQGLKGVRLEVIKVGGTACTSREALQRFFQALTYAEQSLRPEPTDTIVDQPEIERALDARGL